MGGTYWQNVRKSFLPEFISMNFMMSGMAPVMSFLMMGRDMRAMVPSELLFWGVMPLGVIAGFTIAYPANVWMVAGGLKHGLMTDRKSPSRRKSVDHQAKHGEHHDHEAGRPGVGHTDTGRDAGAVVRRCQHLFVRAVTWNGGAGELAQPSSVGARSGWGDHAAWDDHGP